MAWIGQGGPVVPRCVLEGTACADGSGVPWLLVAAGIILALILIIAVIQRLRQRARRNYR